MATNDTPVFYGYDGCETCRKARRWLDAQRIEYEAIPIVQRPPPKGALRQLVAASGLPVRKWFNTSGQSYRALTAELGREGVQALSDDEILARLSADGKLIKRPVLIARGRVLVGFQEDAYRDLFG
jgi:arsenate reductase